MRKKNGKFVNIYFNKDLLEELDKYALSKGQTRTTCIEILIKESLERKGEANIYKAE